ncbi:hypothetical protein GCM10010515_51330 [Streptomyces fructofermentans]|uniref:Uncharacterized protein n=1 Tax=Streptomyces fructofermentans TaxID=152141 RepID=A0A918KUT6_9ACTN|nr:hypothetical protein GCM10010515_51330 [Streptomyces fructofermentans]
MSQTRIHHTPCQAPGAEAAGPPLVPVPAAAFGPLFGPLPHGGWTGLREAGVEAYGGGAEEGPGGIGVPPGGPSLSSRNVAFLVSQTRLLGKGL